MLHTSNGEEKKTDVSFFDEDVEIQKIIKSFVEIHRPLKKEMEDYLVSEDACIGESFREKGSFPYLKRIEIEPIFIS